MKRTDPRLLINLNISDEEFEQHIQLAVDKYIESVVESSCNEKVDAAIKKYVDSRVSAIISEARWSNNSLIEGRLLSDFIVEQARPKVNAAISKIIAEEVSKAIAERLNI